MRICHSTPAQCHDGNVMSRGSQLTITASATFSLTITIIMAISASSAALHRTFTTLAVYGGHQDASYVCVSVWHFMVTAIEWKTRHWKQQKRVNSR